MSMKFTNNATSTLAAGITNVATSLTVATGQGALFPTLGAGDYFYCTLANLAGSVEIIKVTARTGDSFGTIVRAQDGTSALAWNAGDKVELRLVAASLNDIPKLDENNAFTGVNTENLSATSTAVTQAYGDNSTKPATTAFVQAAINAGRALSFRNRAINGAMKIDQRNAGSAQTFTAGAALAYSIDRFWGACTGANASGQQIAGSGNQQALYQFNGSASVTGIQFGQRMSRADTIDLAGTTATFSVLLANSLLTSVTWTAYYANTNDTFGTLASPTKTQIATGTFTVSPALALYSTQISVPAAATTGIEIVLSVGAQTSGAWQIGNFQFEPGASATPFMVTDYHEELRKCQTYFYRSANNEFIWSGNTTTAVTYYLNYILPVSMRVAPSISNITAATGNGFGGIPAANSSTSRSGYFSASSNATQNGSFFYGGADFSAEL